MKVTAILLFAALVGVHRDARADDNAARPREEAAQPQLAVVNATTNLESAGPVKRLRRVLDARNMLVKLDDHLAATLDGRSGLIADLDAIKDAYAKSDFKAALALVDSNEQRLLGEPSSRDPMPALAVLSQWRGLIAAATNHTDVALRWFRAANRFNPAWVMDDRLASPRVRSLVKQAKREPDETGRLRIHCDPVDARISIDGGEPRVAGDRIKLPVGTHLVTITAPKRKAYAELVDITSDLVARIDITLDSESTLDRAAKLVDATAAAPAGKARLKRVGALAKLTGAPRVLVVEDGSAARLTLRVYDVAGNKVSKPVELDGTAPSAAIARRVIAALEPENLSDVDAIVVAERGAAPRGKPWYARWYVWAAVGAAAAAAGGYVVYDQASTEPTMLRL